ncbi:MAG TPA: hypothetical protein VF808_11135 [Ktedonobacterales bacterium]
MPLSIADLPDLIAGLPARERTLAELLFQVEVSEGVIDPPVEMEPWIERTFGSVERARRQRIIRVMNRWTYEGATFNPLRAQRPGAGTTTGAATDPPELRERIARAQGDDFCQPETRTPADTFGRVRGAHTITAANVAKADGWHSVTIFDRHDPLALDEALVGDTFAVALEWARRAHEQDPAARHLFLLWNCLWKAGASLIHGHTQMTLSHGMAHARVEQLRAAASRYSAETGGDYFSDLAATLEALDLRIAADAYVSLTPIKERETLLLAPGASIEEAADRLTAPLWAILRTATGSLGVRAFNVALYGPPLDGDLAWEGFPVVARFVDRGAPLAQTSDIAALELFGSSVISSDPFALAASLR